MSFQAKRELLLQTAPRYQAARHGQKSIILDEFVAATAMSANTLFGSSAGHCQFNLS
jgi:hypothetical protein